MNKKFFNTIDEVKDKLNNLQCEENSLRGKLKSYFLKFDMNDFEGLGLEDLYDFVNKYQIFFSNKFDDDLSDYIKNIEIHEKGSSPHYPFLNDIVDLTDLQKYEIDKYFFEMLPNRDINLNLITFNLKKIECMKNVSNQLIKNVFKKFYDKKLISVLHVFKCNNGDDFISLTFDKDDLTELIKEYGRKLAVEGILDEICIDCYESDFCSAKTNLYNFINNKIDKIMNNPFDDNDMLIRKIKSNS